MIIIIIIIIIIVIIIIYHELALDRPVSGVQGVVKCIQYPLLPKPHPHLPVSQPALTNKAL